MNQILGVAFLAVVFLMFLLIFTSKAIRGSLKIGLLFLGMGLLFWFGNLGLLPYIEWERDWPWILIILGLWMIFSHLFGYSSKHRKRSRKKVIRILEDLETGKISPEEAIRKIREEK